MSSLEASYANSSAPAQSQSLSSMPLLSQVPNLLEYRAESDPDGEFILKTVVGFSAGLLPMFFCLELGWRLAFNRTTPLADQSTDIAITFAAMCGIAAVAASLLLVGLKVRADHFGEPLFARHWLNSIGTGALYAFMLWLPFMLLSHSFHFNRYIMSGIFMLLLAFPALAAKWVIGPHPHFSRPTAPIVQQ